MSSMYKNKVCKSYRQGKRLLEINGSRKSNARWMDRLINIKLSLQQNAAHSEIRWIMRKYSIPQRDLSIRLILAIVAHLDLDLFQMDIKTTFLNEGLDEEIYMDQHLGFIAKGQERKVCRLKRSIYDLKQSSRQWYLKFHEAITSSGLTIVEEDHCVYVKRTKDEILLLSLYVMTFY